jgi:hypothetical protein
VFTKVILSVRFVQNIRTNLTKLTNLFNSRSDGYLIHNKIKVGMISRYHLQLFSTNL